LVVDEDEYVKRCALISLGELKSSKSESLAERAWHTGHEYQRMAALEVLDKISSSKLAIYLKEAMEDGRPHLVKTARKIKKKQAASRTSGGI